jgi:hypothetical protein
MDGRYTAKGARAGRRLVAALLVALMGLGSVVMWLVVPVGCLWGAAQLYQSQTPNFGVYLGVLAAVVVMMVVIGKLLGSLGRLHARLVSEGVSQTRRPAPWMRSMRGERDAGAPTTVLDVVMLTSVSVALLLFGVWFFVFAGSSMPSV